RRVLGQRLCDPGLAVAGGFTHRFPRAPLAGFGPPAPTVGSRRRPSAPSALRPPETRDTPCAAGRGPYGDRRAAVRGPPPPRRTRASAPGHSASSPVPRARGRGFLTS